jgi:hypothetical protein
MIVTASPKPGMSNSNGSSADTHTEQERPERRQAARRRVLKAAVCTHGGKHIGVPCSVRDVSQSGARLRIEPTMAVCKQFELLVEIDGLEAECDTIWRKGHEMGVRFCAPPRLGRKRRQQVVDPMVCQSGLRPSSQSSRLATRGRSPNLFKR